MKRMLIAITAISLTTFSHVQFVKFVAVSGDSAVTDSQALDIAKSAVAFYNQRNIPTVFLGIRRIDDPCQNIDGLSNISKRYECLRHHLYIKGIASNDFQTHIIDRPIHDGGLRYIGGVAPLCPGAFRKVSLSNAQAFNVTGEPRLYTSKKAAQHELGHSKGCYHDSSNPPNVMHPDAGRFASQGLALDLPKKCYRQVGACDHRHRARTARHPIVGRHVQ